MKERKEMKLQLKERRNVFMKSECGDCWSWLNNSDTTHSDELVKWRALRYTVPQFSWLQHHSRLLTAKRYTDISLGSGLIILCVMPKPIPRLIAGPQVNTWHPPTAPLPEISCLVCLFSLIQIACKSCMLCSLTWHSHAHIWILWGVCVCIIPFAILSSNCVCCMPTNNVSLLSKLIHTGIQPVCINLLNRETLLNV